ncbi:MAG: hypothetical protein PWP27_994 [Clostridiales bacterium]|jgi:hypothetical protein|nr:hypothetical protein [Clostridiales bacterium]MDK2933184.1 hypothetical protein [Clostridiales bacterium]
MSRFIANPFIPERKVSHVIIDGRISSKILFTLKNLGITPVLTSVSNGLYPAVSCHPDMLIHPIGNDVLIVAPDIYEFIYSKLKPLNFKLIKGKSILKSNYPENIAYNVARIDNFAFHNVKYTDPMIREYFEQLNIKIINVKQGYTKCSTCIVNHQAIITSDKGIAKAADNYNIDVLLIEPGHILLPGLDYGFIGGATGLISKNLLAVSGRLDTHPNYADIIKFCSNYNVHVVNLGEQQVIDIGSIVPILVY